MLVTSQDKEIDIEFFHFFLKHVNRWALDKETFRL